MKQLRMIIPVGIFILLDQAIKIYISKNLMNTEVDLLGNILGFKPYLNDKYSWFNSMADAGVGLAAHIIVVFLIIILAIFFYDFIRAQYKTGVYVQWLFIFLFAGSLCSLIDKAAWGGSLDYVWLKGFFIFDLKDCYLSAADVMLVLYLFLKKEFRNAKVRAVFSEFVQFFKLKYLRHFDKTI